MIITKWLGTLTGVFGTAGNWSNGVPVTGDTAIFDQDATGDLAGSDQSAITLAAMIVYQGFLKSIGTTATPLKIASTLVQIGLQVDPAAQGGGAHRVVLDLHTVQTTVVVYNTGSSTPDTGLENVRIKGAHASNALYVLGGSVGVGTNKVDDTAQFPTMACSGGRLNVGGGVTMTTLTYNGNAQGNIFSGLTTLTLNGQAKVASYGDYAITTVTLNGGDFLCNHRKNSGASITTLNQQGGNIDVSADPRALTVTTLNRGAGTFKRFSNTQVTITTLAENNGTNLSETKSFN